jgi:hypothetical protein
MTTQPGDLSIWALPSFTWANIVDGNVMNELIVGIAVATL